MSEKCACCNPVPEETPAENAACCEEESIPAAAEMPAEAGECCGCRHKKRTEEEYRSLIHRLNRIEGQVRGIRGMVEKDVYCTDILVQVAAANSALNAFAKELLSQHVRTCVAEDLRAGGDEKLDELLRLLPKLMK